MGIETNKHMIEQLRAGGVKVIGFHEKGELAHIEFFPLAPQPAVQGVSMMGINDMPPDDVMMFASTPTFDEIIEKDKA